MVAIVLARRRWNSVLIPPAKGAVSPNISKRVGIGSLVVQFSLFDILIGQNPWYLPAEFGSITGTVAGKNNRQAIANLRGF
jgi:hypothetical protein